MADLDNDQVMEVMLRHAAAQLPDRVLAIVLLDLLGGLKQPDLLAEIQQTLSLPRPSPAERGADLGAAVAATPRSEARISTPHCGAEKSTWARLGAAARRLDDSLLGDLIGAACLFATGYVLIVMAGVLS